MKIKSKLIVFAAATSACSLLAACGNGGGSVADASKREIVVASAQGVAASLDPTQTYDGWYTVRYGIAQTLTKYNDDMSISGWLVEDGYTSNEDSTEWTFTIKDNVKFSNGNKLDANAVKASIENVFTNGERGPEYFTYDSIEADGQKLTIKLKNADPILPNKLSDPLFSIIDTSADITNIATNGPVGTGPFKVESFNPTNKEVSVVKNENYWNGDVALNKATFVYTEEQANLNMGLKSGQFDAVYNLSMNDIGSYEGDSNYKIVTNPSGRTSIGFMNQQESRALNDKTLREAVLMAQDKETYCKSLLKGRYVVGKTLLTSAADYGYNELTDPYSYNKEAAVKLLDDAGYKDVDGDGFRESPSGEKIELNYVYYTGRPEQQILVEATQSSMADIGIKVVPDVKETATVMEMQKAGNYDLLSMSINMMNCGDPVNQIKTYFCEGGSYSSTGYTSASFNQKINEADVEKDVNKRKSLIKEAEQILLDDAVAIYYCYPKMNFVTKSNVKNVYSTPADFYWIDEHTSIG